MSSSRSDETARSGSWFGKLRSDVFAGLINAVVSVPSGLATAALAGVNPVYGLYTTTAAPIAGSLLTSAQLMQLATTGASALVAGQAIASYPADQRGQALFLLVFLGGIFLVVFGLLRFGRLLRYVSNAVMTAFLSGVATVLVLDQLAQLVGYSPEGQTSLGQFVDLLLNIGDASPQATLIGVLALAIMVGLSRTPLTNVASLFALVIPTVLVVLWEPDGVRLVSDVSTIPRGLPPLGLPDFGLLSLDLVLSAFALAVVIAVQGAGISQSYENPDGSPTSPSRDMLAQGAGNVAAGLVSGMPAGGSVSQTALNVSVGARSRWAGVFHGLSMLVIILLVPGLVSLVPMTVLAALMIVAGLGAIDFREARSIWRTGGSARWGLVVTFGATLVLSIPTAVATGVALTVVLFVVYSASDARVRALERREDGEIVVVDVPEKLPSEKVTVLDVYGSLFFAAVRKLRESLPSPEGADRPVVVLRLRGNNQVGATVIDALNDYAHELAEAGGRLYLTGMDEVASEKLRRAEKLRLDEEVYIYPATEVLGGSTRDAIEAANAWLLGTRDDSPPKDEEAP
jgi:sulfate permease, SulP family